MWWTAKHDESNRDGGCSTRDLAAGETSRAGRRLSVEREEEDAVERMI